MHTQLNDVRQFMAAFGQPTPESKQAITEQLRFFRYKLIDEEAVELLKSDTLVEYTDAVVDLLYVVLGAAVAAGIDEKTLDLCWKEVHRSNMSKFWTNEETVTAPDGAVVEPAGKACPGRWVVKKGGKVIKSPSYSKANLEQYL